MRQLNNRLARLEASMPPSRPPTDPEIAERILSVQEKIRRGKASVMDAERFERILEILGRVRNNHV